MPAIIYRFLVLLSIFSEASAATIRIDWSTIRTLYSHDGTTPLSQGGAGSGDGTLLELGFYSSATQADPFVGNWMVLGTSSIGDDGVGLAGRFSTSLTLTDTSAGLAAPGTPLSIRFYDAPTIAAATYFNAASSVDSSWNWITPTTPETVLPLVIAKAYPVTFQSFKTSVLDPFFTIIPIPEPSAIYLLGGAAAGWCLRRRKCVELSPPKN